MEQNLPIAGKKIWSIVRVVFYMLRKEMSKRKLMSELNLMMKRGKIAGKAISNLMFHYHPPSTAARRSHDARSSSASSSSSTGGPLEYEFSCSDTPHYNFPNFHANNKRKHLEINRHLHNFFACGQPPSTMDDDVPSTFNFDMAIMEMMLNNNNNQQQVEPAATPAVVQASPMLPGFGRTPLVRPVRITDSPFPLKEEEEEDPRTDKAAEEFIQKFYRQLQQQRSVRRG